MVVYYSTFYPSLSLLQIKEEDIQSSLDVIGQLWEVIDISRSSSSQMKEQMKELEEKWQDEKKNKRLTERVSLMNLTFSVQDIVSQQDLLLMFVVQRWSQITL